MSRGDDREDPAREEARRVAIRRELRRAMDKAWYERFRVWPVWVLESVRPGVCPGCGRPF